MSRIEEDRENARRAEKLMQQKRDQEQRAKEKVVAESAFSRLVQKSKAESELVKRDDATRDQVDDEATVLDDALQDEATERTERDTLLKESALYRQRRGERGRLDRNRDAAHAQGKGEVEGKANEQAHAGRAADQGAGEGRAASRRGDARTQREALDERREASDAAKGAMRGGGGRAGKGELKADADGGKGQQGGSGKDSKQGGGELAAGFRFNPALMAPIPVQVPKSNAGSERLRALATEIAQKIVERVRVGTNAAGHAEFQIELRSNVLSGLSVKVSASRGRISAVFSGNDREVLRMLRDQADALKGALAGRGLELEELKVEDTA